MAARHIPFTSPRLQRSEESSKESSRKPRVVKVGKTKARVRSLSRKISDYVYFTTREMTRFKTRLEKENVKGTYLRDAACCISG